MPAKKIAIIAISLVALVAVLIGGVYFNWNRQYRGRIYPGVMVGKLDLSGLNQEEARRQISRAIAEIEKAGLELKYESESRALFLTPLSLSSDSSYPALIFDIEGSLKQAWEISENSSFFNYLIFRINPFKQRNFSAEFSLDELRTKTMVAEIFPALDIPAKNANFDSGSPLSISPERLGKSIDYDFVLSQIRSRLENLSLEIIEVRTITDYPLVTAEDLEKFRPEAQDLLNRGPWKIIFSDEEGEKSWEIRAETLAGWLAVKDEGRKSQLSLDQEKIKNYLSEKISPEIDQEAIQPRFEIAGSRVSSWQVGRSGRQVDLEESATKIEASFLNLPPKSAELVIKEISAEDLSAENRFQIEEIVGTGHSNFSGSPANRRHNIKTGANALHGLLIKPGAEFSLIKALGEIEAKTGYLPELVIKGNKTIPEYGGGLCQIGTTIFRAALASGLPITARRNHSYRVSYYEPAGTDATIYDPSPDLKFINDTNNYILIQARISGNDLYFDFWGKSDGRTATTTYPTIYNIVKPAPTKIIETTELAPGEKKCTESAHNGADAFFDYTVVYPEGATTTSVQTRRFSSHYIPWQEVCLLGVESASSTSATTSPETKLEEASSTPEI